ncbi:hypothetical protein [Arsenophonus sp. ENCA]|uniref:hypothetical protein n=1 Tax=Arsenophonus sp. ENCA TaxID=1987579 RepID=UPI0025C38277|nr:hypothetical protein [Arsenophonus sp. ENCA]
MSGYPCIKDIYKIFLQVSSVRYSSLALSEVSPSPLSHDTYSAANHLIPKGKIFDTLKNHTKENYLIPISVLI